MPVQQEIHPAFSERLHGGLSDHATQSVSVALVDIDGSKPLSGKEVRGATLNMLNKCSEKKEGKDYSNNPFNIEENTAQYKARKRKQFEYIIQEVVPHNDFMLLQEVDGITDKQLGKAFWEQLREAGWELIVTIKPQDSNFTQQPLAIIYNKATLTPVKGTATGILPMTKKGIKAEYEQYRGFAVDFTRNGTNERINIANLHLDFTHKGYSAEIGSEQQKLADRGITSIWGGDTNHAPNDHLAGLIANWEVSTNIDGAPDPKNSGAPWVLTDEHKVTSGQGNQTYKKHYDGFLVCPRKDAKAIITEEAGQQFQLQNDGTFKVVPFGSKP